MKWVRNKCRDGTVQYWLEPYTFEERDLYVCRDDPIDVKGMLRGCWYLIDKAGEDLGVIIAGPFPTLKAAKAAYMVLR